jgi:hypothetical protein
VVEGTREGRILLISDSLDPLILKYMEKLDPNAASTPLFNG